MKNDETRMTNQTRMTKRQTRQRKAGAEARRRSRGQVTDETLAREAEQPYDLAHKGKTYDLEERTAFFGEQVLDLAKQIPVGPVTEPLIRQLVRAGTSVGANYCEANDAASKKDFQHKIGLCKKEARETMHWLRMVVRAQPEMKAEARRLWREAKELNLIFGAIGRQRRDS